MEVLGWGCSDGSVKLVKVIVGGGCVEGHWRLSELGNKSRVSG